MNRNEFNDWLRAENACQGAVKWCNEHPELSVQELMGICPRGEWILWVYSKAGYAPEVLVPVAYRAATRATGYAADALDMAGVQHGLRGLVIHDAESARAAGDAARAAAWDAGDAALAAWDAARAAEDAALDAARAVAWAAACAAGAAARDAEHQLCADDCRQMLPELRIEV